MGMHCFTILRTQNDKISIFLDREQYKIINNMKCILLTIIIKKIIIIRLF